MRAVLAYVGVTAVVVSLLAAGVVGVVAGAEPAGVWLAAGIAWVVQGVAFALLVAGREGPRFVAGWAGGTVLRFAAVGVAAVWVTQASRLDPATVLVGLVGFIFVLVLLEPLFLRLAD
ncbi:MAG: hypothetical protein ACOC3J_05075 [Gemmatimonadota bacterium]